VSCAQHQLCLNVRFKCVAHAPRTRQTRLTCTFRRALPPLLTISCSKFAISVSGLCTIPDHPLPTNWIAFTRNILSEIRAFLLLLPARSPHHGEKRASASAYNGWREEMEQEHLDSCPPGEGGAPGIVGHGATHHSAVAEGDAAARPGTRHIMCHRRRGTRMGRGWRNGSSRFG
jgi:hypothetical protein